MKQTPQQKTRKAMERALFGKTPTAQRESATEGQARNTAEPVEFTPGPWRVSPYNPRHVIARARGDAGVADTTAPLFINQMEPQANAVAIATLPALLALLEQYRKSFPTKESGKLIAQAKGWA